MHKSTHNLAIRAIQILDRMRTIPASQWESVAQLVEHVTFNHRVAGSSPAGLIAWILYTNNSEHGLIPEL